LTGEDLGNLGLGEAAYRAVLVDDHHKHVAANRVLFEVDPFGFAEGALVILHFTRGHTDLSGAVCKCWECRGRTFSGDLEFHALVACSLEGFCKLRDEFGSEGITTFEAEGLRAAHRNERSGCE